MSDVSLGYTRTEAAKRLGVSTKTVDRMLEDGRLANDEQGRIERESVARRLLEVVDQDVPDEERQGQRALDYAIRHSEAMSRVVLPHTLRLLDVMTREVESGRAALREMQTMWIDGLRAREEAESRRHERELDLQEARTNETLKQQAMTLLQEALPQLISQMSTPKGPEGLDQLLELVRGLDTERIGLLWALGVISPEQAATIARLAGVEVPPAPESDAATTPTTR